MCYLDDGERCDVWRECEVRGRKAHTCDVCRLPIVAGLTHTRIDSLFDTTWTTYRVHPDCYALTRYIQIDVCEQGTYTLDGEGLRHEVREHMGESPELLRMYRRVLRARIREGVWPERKAA